MRLGWIAIVCVLPTPALAQAVLPAIPWLGTEWAKGRIETMSGGGLQGEGWSGYAGAVFGLDAPLAQDGWRLRLLASQAQYRYQRTCVDALGSFTQTCGDAVRGGRDPRMPTIDERSEITLDFQGSDLQGEAMAGYALHLPRAVVKLYAGAEYLDATVLPDDAVNTRVGDDLGAKLLVEYWQRLADGVWASLDASLSSIDTRYAAQVRLGHETFAVATLGVEAAAFGDAEYDTARLGAFVTMRWGAQHYTLSGGVTGAYEVDGGSYVGLSTYRRF